MTNSNAPGTKLLRVAVALTVALALGPASAASAQVRISSLDELRRTLSPGDVISIVPTAGDTIEGRLLRLGDVDVEIRTDSGRTREQRRAIIAIPLNTVQAIERRRDSSRNGALIGAAVGAGAIGVLFVRAAVIDRNEIDEWAPIYLGYGAVFTGIGALVGWAIDAAHSKPHITFSMRATKTTSLTILPALTPDGGAKIMVTLRKRAR